LGAGGEQYRTAARRHAEFIREESSGTLTRFSELIEAAVAV
jgi:hypothetical protein